jgi:class 3 adenylate cyclase
MNSVANGNLDLQLAASNRVDEIGQLAQTFNSMTRQLQRTQSQLHQYLNPMAIKEAYRRAREEQTQPQAEEKDISVLFVDIVSFTSTSERLGPTATVAYLNNFYDSISESIRDANGYIDKFVADELICVFEGQAHAEDAVNTARKILDNLKGCTDCKVRIGINSGLCIIADIGSRLMGRMDRTIIGDTVNVAQRLMTAAEPDSAVFSLTTWQGIDNREDITPLAPQKLKGKAFPVKAFALGYNIHPLPITTDTAIQEIALAS